VADEIELLRRFIDETPGPSTDAWARARLAVAAARSEEEPAGRRPSRNPGRRRRRLLAITAGAAVAATVAGLLAVLLPEPPASTGGQQIQTAAYVTRIERALAYPRQDALVGYARTVYPPGTVLRPTGGLTAGPGSGSRWRVHSTVTWAYQGSLKTSAFTAAGRPVFTERTTHAGGATRTLAVIYADATWWRRTTAPGSPPGRTPPCPSGITPGLTIIAQWASFIRDQLRCGGYRMDGRQRIDGIDAVKLTGGKALVALWVNPATYLPVRVISGFGGGEAGAGARGRGQTDFRWLSPGQRALSQLSVRVPEGFRQVPPPS
jgi:hypothetical protein